MGRLTGKRAVITGGTTGIGFAVAQRFLQEGARVAVTGQNPDRVEDARRALGPDVLAIRSDAGSVSDTEAMIDQVGGAFGGIEIMVLNAGIGQFVPLSQVTEAMFDQSFAVNVKGVLFAVQRAEKLLQPGASIIVTTSSSNRIGFPGAVVYAATKAATRSMVRTLARELADRNIRVNALCPGPIETPIFGKTGASPEEIEGFKAFFAAKTVLGRMGQPEEMASIALFLASDDSSYVTGAEITADAGWTEVGA